MITRHILACAMAGLLAAPALHAQAPATTPPATPPAATPPATTPAPGGAPAKPKQISMNDGKALTDLLEAMQFHIRMGEVARHKDKEDKELVAFANKNHKEMTGEFTPMVTLAQANQLKNIPTEASKSDKADIGKLSKAKADKWKLEYFELLAKNGKRNVRSAETALKSISDPAVKAAATKVAALMTSQTAAAEAKEKELKEKK